METTVNSRVKLRTRRFLQIILLLITFSPFFVFSQGGKVIFDSKGTDFWLGYLPNWHNNLNSIYPELNRGDSLYIFIVADEPTTGQIEYKDFDGNSYLETFNITDPKKIYTFKVTHVNFEVTGFNQSGKFLSMNDSRNQCEQVGINSFHVTSSNEVTVYAHSQAVTTSDAFMVLPTDVLGTEHLVLAYNSHGSGYWNGILESSTPSQFLIVATVDATNIFITSNEEFYRNGRNPINVTLNKGEVFLVQAKITSSSLRTDLTGTEILSDKPIAVFAGQQRTIVPIDSASLSSRDCLIEQMLPIKTWGKNAYIVPYILPNGATDSGSDIFRVLFADDNTDLYVNGYHQGRYLRGEYYEGDITGAIALEATNPILVAQYKKTSQGPGAQQDPYSDPFMMLVPPKEQFMSEYNVINTQAYEPDETNNVPNGRYSKVYQEHYIAVVANEADIVDTRIDNNIIAKSQFKLIPSTDYYYANVKVSEGSHKVTSSGRVGVYVYGYGYANSYGYVGGLSMMEFDFKRPQLLAKDSCYRKIGMAFDTNRNDTKLYSLITDQSKNKNVIVEIEKFQAYKDSASFKAILINKYQDGYFQISAKDSVGLDSTKIFDIPGFTVALDSIGARDSVIYFKRNYRTGRDFCNEFRLQNYGKFDHDITDLYFKKRTDVQIGINAPFTIEKGEEIPLEICVRSDVDTVLVDTLYIEEPCGDRKLLIIDFTFKSDTEDPDLLLSKDSCNRMFKLIVTDSTTFDWGLKEVKIDTILNCRAVKLINSLTVVSYTIEVIDQHKDAIFSISVEDSVGNKLFILDTIQGFTLEFPQFTSQDKKIDFGYEKISHIKFDTLAITNTGILPFKIDNIFLKRNIIYSIPKATFPLIISPSDSEKVIIGFHPNNIYEEFRDTIVISHNCLFQEIDLFGLGDTLIHYGEADCGVVIKTVANSIDRKYDLEGTLPNPVISTSVFSFNLAEEDFVTLEIYDLVGNQKKDLINTKLSAGKHSIEFELSDLPQGSYVYIIKTSYNALSGRFVKM